jgi:hypothetical protein
MTISRRISIGIYAAATVVISGFVWYKDARDAWKADAANSQTPCDVHIRSDGQERNYLIGVLQTNKSAMPKNVHIIFDTNKEFCGFAQELHEMFIAAGWGNIVTIDRDKLFGDGVIFHADKGDDVAINLYSNLSSSHEVRLDLGKTAKPTNDWVFWIKDNWPRWMLDAKVGN